jgi:hypothetical protein
VGIAALVSSTQEFFCKLIVNDYGICLASGKLWGKFYCHNLQEPIIDRCTLLEPDVIVLLNSDVYCVHFLVLYTQVRSVLLNL